MRKIGMMVKRTHHTGIEDQKIQLVSGIAGITVVEIPRIHNDQVAFSGGEGMLVDAHMGGSGTDVHQFNFLMPVRHKADVPVSGLPYHEIGMVSPHLVKCLHGTLPFCLLHRLLTSYQK